MPENIKLSKRLEKVASFLPENTTFADIGSDHAYLPAYVCLQDTQSKAIAVEVNEGPYQSALETIEKYQLTNRIEVRLGNGLAPLNKGEVYALVIAGMGGALIRTILEEGKSKLTNVNRIIAQPNVDESSVRKWLIEHQYSITNEIIIKENGHIYEIIVGEYEPNIKVSPLTEKELLFGPLLIKQKPEEFYQKWRLEKEKKENVIRQLQKASHIPMEKINHFKQQLQWIEEVL